jgi:exonuclease VII small subunit
MSSRKLDKGLQIEMATMIAEQAGQLAKATALLGHFNKSITRLEQQLQELSEANDDLDRRILALERG